MARNRWDDEYDSYQDEVRDRNTLTIGVGADWTEDSRYDEVSD